MTGPSPFRVLLAAAVLGVTVAASGCGGDDEPSTPDDKAGRLALLEQEAAAAAGDARGRSALEVREDVEGLVLEFDRIEITPSEATVKTERFSVQSFLKPGASPFTEVTFKWTVDGRELVGYEVSKLGKKEGRWKALDWITVQAVAVDEQGRQAESKPVAVQIGNGTPQITTSLTNSRYLNGKQLQAEDPDDDPITWSVEGGAPGITITASGVIYVRDVQLEEPFEGEVIFVAEDPHGARNELHLPMTINAASAAKTEDAGVEVREAGIRELTDAELMRQAEEDAKLVESLSEDQLRKLIEEREAARNK